MSIGAFVRREFTASVERSSLFRDRLLAASLAGAVVVACLGVWDWMGWDRLSVHGAALFARATFGMVAFVQLGVAFGFTASLTVAIASERDRKSLDSLLATRFTSAEVVVGVMAAHLLRTANAMLATFPVIVLLVYLGGIDPRLAWLSTVAASATAVGVAGLCVLASVESRTAVRASFAAGWLIFLWYALPAMFLIFRTFVLPPLPTWMIPPVLWALDGTPYGLVMNLLGLFPRPWGLVEGVFRLAATQIAMAVVATAWAAYRLRPASRELNDAEGRAGALKALRLAARWREPRRSCGDDPIFWNERYVHRAGGRFQRFASRLLQFVATTVVAVGVSWFAAPAFVELAARGHGPSREAYRAPEVNPFTRVIAERLVVGSVTPPESGRARLEFNLVIRQMTALLALAFAAGIVAAGAESINRERLRDTWLGLLATPLTGPEIVRGKSRGALWRSREAVGWLLTMWLLGIISGAIHPLGGLAVVAWLGISYPLYASLGVLAGLHSEKAKWPLDPAAWPRALAAVAGMMALIGLVPAILAAMALFTYEEVQAAIHGGPVPWLVGAGVAPWLSSRTVAVGWLFATAALALGTFRLHRSLGRSFDAEVGRPHRPSNDGDRWREERNSPGGHGMGLIRMDEASESDNDAREPSS